jgi:hypothetical protein
MLSGVVTTSSVSSLKYILSTHILTYSIRQQLYNEFLDGSLMEKQFKTLFTFQHTLQFTDVWVFTCIVYMLSLYLNDLKYKKSFETVVDKKSVRNIIHSIELLFFIFAIIFTKDVENAI